MGDYEKEYFDQPHLRHLVCLLVIVLGFCFSISIVYGQRTDITSVAITKSIKKVGDKTSTSLVRLIVETRATAKEWAGPLSSNKNV